MLAWLKKFRRLVAPKEPSDLEIANATFAHVMREFDASVEAYRTGMVKIACRAADRGQLERIRDCRETKRL